MTAATTPRTIREGVYAWLVGAEPLTGSDARLGTRDEPRIYPHVAPSGLGPDAYLVYKRSDAPGEQTLRAQGDLRFATFDFEVWGARSSEVEEVTEALRDWLEAAVQQTVGAIAIRSVTLLGEVDDAARLEDGSEEIHAVSVLTARLSYKKLGGV